MWHLHLCCLAALVGPPAMVAPLPPGELASIYSAALRDTFGAAVSPRYEVPSRVFLSIGRGTDPKPDLLARLAGLPFAVRKRSECPKRPGVLGAVCKVGDGEAEVWLGAVKQLAPDAVELWVAVGEVSCPRRLRRDSSGWRMLTTKEYVGACRIS